MAIKLESVKSKHPQLLYESKLYRILAGGVGIPNVLWSAGAPTTRCTEHAVNSVALCTCSGSEQVRGSFRPQIALGSELKKEHSALESEAVRRAPEVF